MVAPPNEQADSPELKLYAATSGFNGLFSPSHVFAWQLEINDVLLCSNSLGPPELIPGTIDKGFYAALLEALQHAPQRSHIRLLAPRGSELFWVFSQSLEERQKAGYRKKTSKGKTLRSNHTLQRQVDAYCLDHGLILTAAEPVSSHEIEARFSVEDDAKQRLRDACGADELA